MTTVILTKQDGSLAEGSARIVHKPDTPAAGSWYWQLEQETTDNPAYIDLASADVLTASDASATSALQLVFDSLAAKWQKETVYLSSPNTIAEHPAYQEIIGMGEQAIPMILRNFQETQAEWFWALRSIARESPVKPESRGNIDAMTADWLDWGKRRRYI